MCDLKKLITFVCLILVFSLTSTIVFADDNLNINKNIVESTLLENGDLKIIQDITYDFKDKYNGVYWNIVLKDTDGIEDVKVYELVQGQPVQFTQNVEPEKGDTGLFKYTETDNNLELMIFSPANDESKTFRLEYILKNVSIRHLDTGELYYQFLGDGNEEKIDYFEATIQLPKIDKERVKIFAHGPLSGQINFGDNNRVKLEVSNIPPNTFIEGRIFFPLEYIPNSNKTGTETLDTLMEEELSYIQDIEEDRIKSENRKSILNTISSVLTVIGAALVYFFFNKYKRNPNAYETMDSLVPENISPAELKLFMNSFLDGRSIIATIFDLARREYIRIDNLGPGEGKKSIFAPDEPQEHYSFTKTNKSNEDLSTHEIFFLNWIFDKIGNGEYVTTEDIDFSRRKQALEFSSYNTQWTKLVKEDLKGRHYYDEENKKYFVYLLFPAVIFLVFGTISIISGGFIGLVLIFLSLGMFVMSIAIATRKSDKGYVQYQLWKSFMKEMNVFEDIDVDIPKDKYLIYAIALGVTMKDMNEYRDTVAYGYYPMYWGTFYYASLNKSGGSKFEDSMNSSFYGAVGTSTATSSSVGGGGGFSGGGGGGAGGGGGGGGF